MFSLLVNAHADYLNFLILLPVVYNMFHALHGPDIKAFVSLLLALYPIAKHFISHALHVPYLYIHNVKTEFVGRVRFQQWSAVHLPPRPRPAVHEPSHGWPFIFRRGRPRAIPAAAGRPCLATAVAVLSPTTDRNSHDLRRGCPSIPPPRPAEHNPLLILRVVKYLANVLIAEGLSPGSEVQESHVLLPLLN